MIVKVIIDDTELIAKGSVKRLCNIFDAEESLDYVSSINSALKRRGISSKCHPMTSKLYNSIKDNSSKSLFLC